MKINKNITRNRFSLISASFFPMLGISMQLEAQTMGIWYDTEIQSDFKGNYNHVNMLYLSAEYDISEQIKLSAASISIAKTKDERLTDDLQVFSNIEADNHPLALAVAGVSWTPNNRHLLFAGIRNVNEDYFTSPVTSFFTNSSCGIFPTLSCNMDIANYPVASIGFHYAYTSESFGLQASVYNGAGYKDFTGRKNVWRFAPTGDGLFLISQADYSYQDGHYYLGAAHHTGTSQSDLSAQSAVWGYTEQQLTPHLALLGCLSQAWGNDCQCTSFIGLGGQYMQGKSTYGIFSDYARFSKDKEWATELTYKHDLTPSVFLQASCHFMNHDSWQTAALIRLGIRM